VISVGHRPELELFHQRRLVLARGQEGAKLVRDEPLTPSGFIVRRVLGTLFRRPRAERS
jgi:putative ATP-binding cassette transporter